MFGYQIFVVFNSLFWFSFWIDLISVIPVVNCSWYHYNIPIIELHLCSDFQEAL